MFYKPRRERQWDSWMLRWKDRYYMFYINVSDGGSRWDGVSLATSADLIHWEEYGRVLSKDEDAVWLGTGMVHRVGGRFFMNYSQEKPAHTQRVYFAESEDLLHWRKIPDACSAPDGAIYRSDPEEMCDIMPRWDSLGVFEPLSGNPPPYYAFCTANARNAPHAGDSGVLGLVESDDGLNWRCLPPAFDDPTKFTACEVPEYVSFENRHYALFCASSYLGFRRDPYAEWAVGGTFYLTADRATGPYRLPEGDPMLQGTRDHDMVCMNYVGRTFRDGDKRLYYHIWGEPASDAWMGAVKELYEPEPYRLALRWYSGNEALKGESLLGAIEAGDFSETMRAGVQPAVFWSFAPDSIGFRSNGSAMCLAHAGLSGASRTGNDTDLRDGRVVEFSLAVTGAGAGFYFESRDERRICIFFNKKRNLVEFGEIRNGWGGNCLLRPELKKEWTSGRDRTAVRILARRQFLEVYADDRYVGGWRLSERAPGLAADEIDPNRFGVYSEDSDGAVESLRVWQMK